MTSPNKGNRALERVYSVTAGVVTLVSRQEECAARRMINPRRNIEQFQTMTAKQPQITEAKQ